jgi:hypothetical protein
MPHKKLTFSFGPFFHFTLEPRIEVPGELLFDNFISNVNHDALDFALIFVNSVICHKNKDKLNLKFS